MLEVLEKPTATQPFALPSRVKSRKPLSSLFVLIPKKKSQSLGPSQSLGKRWEMRYCEVFLWEKAQNLLQLLFYKKVNIRRN